MKTKVPYTRILNGTVLLLAGLLLTVAVHSQTFTSKKNGAWSNASTWQGGVVPPVNGNITAGMVINIKHRVSYAGSSISNEGTINISNIGGPSPRLLVSSGIDITNKASGKILITDAELRQYRFLGGLEFGISRSGKFKNDGGVVEVKNSYVEIAEDWSNESGGKVLFRNSSLSVGKNYDLRNDAIDTLIYTSVSVGMHGSGDFTVNGNNVKAYYNKLRVQVASVSGKFYLQSGTVNGNIDHVTLKNHVTGLMSLDKLKASTSIITTGIELNSYCVTSPLCFEPNGKFTGTQILTTSLSYFPAKLFASASSSSLNMTDTPVLVSGTDLQVGAKYQYEGIVPGIDAFVTIDSLVNGATISMLDDNDPGSGFTEGFQPQITSGAYIGYSYVSLKFEYFVSGTNTPAEVADLTLTAIDIDGTATYKEFDIIDLGPGATAAYVFANPTITLTQVGPGAFRGINADGITVNGVDTMSKNNMFTVHNTNVSTFSVKMGLYNTEAIPTLRQFSFYSKGFIYPVNYTLPVTMESFTVTLNGNGKKADLKWTTASEQNLSHFVVERSTDGTHFTEAGLVFAYGNTTEKMNYSFQDEISNLNATIIYYRLRSEDKDGSAKYSATRIIRLNKENNNVLTILAYPNPVVNELRMTIPAGWQNKKVVFELVSANGTVVKRVSTGSSNQTETMNVQNLSPGFYILRATSGQEMAQQKIIKQ